MMPVVRGGGCTRWFSLGYTAALVVISPAVGVLRPGRVVWERRVFRYSLIYLSSIFIVWVGTAARKDQG